MKQLRETYMEQEREYKKSIKALDDACLAKYAQIDKIRRQIEKLERKRSDLQDTRPSQHEVIRDLAKKISEELGNLPFEVFGPFGLCAQTSIYLKDTDGGKYVLRLRPYDGPEDWITYDTGKMRTDHFCPPGSIGDLNGINCLYEPLPDDFEKVMDLVRKSKFYPTKDI